MRKLFSILLLLTLGFSLYGYHLFFHVQIVRAKTEMKDFLQHQKNDDNLVVFHFTNADVKLLEWEDEYEFRYDGRMYDVVDQKIENGNLVIRCIQDEKETALLDDFLKTTKSNKLAWIVQLFTTAYVLPRMETPALTETHLPTRFSRISIHFQTPLISVLIPPPDQI